MRSYAQQYNFHIRRINAARRGIDVLNNETLGELGKLTKEEKAEKKRLQQIEKAERRALNKLMSKKQRRKIAKQAKKQQKTIKSVNGFIGDLNKAGAATLPLTEQEEIFRQASIAGDFSSMNQMAPFGKAAWLTNTSLGKYRFVVGDESPNGQMIYVPWTDGEIDTFLAGPWLNRDPATGLAPLIHPRRTRQSDFVKKANDYKKSQAKAMQKFPANDSRHVYSIKPGEYIFKSGLKSTWVKVRAPVVAAVAVVAAVYLGPAVLAKVKTLGATTSGGVSVEGVTSAKVFAGAQQLTGYVNNARTIEAIAKGEMPPPPVSISGNNFTEWAMIEAKEKFVEDMQRQMTLDEERQMRREIEAMQRELNAMIPRDTPIEPSPELNSTVKQMQITEENKAADVAKIMQFALPAAIAFLAFKGFG